MIEDALIRLALVFGGSALLALAFAIHFAPRTLEWLTGAFAFAIALPLAACAILLGMLTSAWRWPVIIGFCLIVIARWGRTPRLPAGERAQGNAHAEPRFHDARIDAEAVLVRLGYSAKQARKAVASAVVSLEAGADVSTIVKAALRR